MNYDLYHDESKEAGYWHGILLVPQETRYKLLDSLALIRDRTKYAQPICLKGLDRTTGPRYRCTRGWISLGVAALIQKLKGRPYPYYTGDDRQFAGMANLNDPIGAKFI